MTAPPRPAAFRFSTAGRPAHDAFDEYRTIFAGGAEAMRHRPGFFAELEGFEFTRMMVHRRRLAGIRHVRDAPLVRRADFSHFTLTLCVAGSVGAVVDGAERRITPGEIVLADMTRPGLIQVDRAETITAAVAREIVEAAVGEPWRLNGRVVPAAAAAPLRRYLVSLTGPAPAEAASWLPEEQVADRLHDALSPEASAPARRARARRLLSAHRVIEAHLADPGFDAAQLATALRMSRATLYRLFEPLGGVASHLLDRRLSLLRRFLAEQGRATPAWSLAARAGLNSDSHASRAFLQRFGERPGRFAAAVGGLGDAVRAARSMALWPRLLA